jgi:hypothetical protein
MEKDLNKQNGRVATDKFRGTYTGKCICKPSIYKCKEGHGVEYITYYVIIIECMKII